MKCISATICFLLLVAACQGSNSLRVRSPFLPEGYNKNQAAKPTAKPMSKQDKANFQLKGITTIGSKYIFSIIDKKTGTSLWLEPNESVNGFTVLAFNPIAHEIEFEWKGQRGTLKLEKEDGTPLAVLESKLADMIRKDSPGSTQNASSRSSPTSSRHNSSSNSPSAPRNTPSNGNSRIDFRNYFAGGGNVNSTAAQADPNTPDSRFGSDEGPSENPTASPEDTTAVVTRYKVKRINSVNNPNGKPPSHRQ